jgi:predicted proteasome-type protease
MFDAARIVGEVLREVMAHDGEHVRPHGDPGATFLFAGQMRGERHRLFLVYPAGNFIEATPETPFLQADETKYGKLILDRVISYESTLAKAAKCALLSFDATTRSSFSVAPPIDLLCYREGGLRAEMPIDIAGVGAYFGALRADPLRSPCSYIRVSRGPWSRSFNPASKGGQGRHAGVVETLAPP